MRLLCIILCLYTSSLYAQSVDTTAFPRKTAFPTDHLFDPILLDPLQSQTYGSVLPFYSTDGSRYPGSTVPFAFGTQKPFLRKERWSSRAGVMQAREWTLDVASFTQFEVYRDPILNKQKRQLVNTDYRVGVSYHLRRGVGTWRFRLYHISSHLGDDYIIRNQLNYYLPNPVNYELIDATYSRLFTNGLRVYGGAGVVLRKSEERKRISAQAGFFYRKPTQNALRFVAGVDIKVWQQTDFKPGIKAAIGAELGRGNPFTLLVEGYSGFRPYSLYESQTVNWLGVGLYLNPF
jgi:Protein of unknown function (DUF1207)